MTMERKLIIADKIILGIDKHGSPEILEKFDNYYEVKDD